MIGTHKRAGRCYCLLRRLRAFVLFLRAFPFFVVCVLSQHFAACVLFILRRAGTFLYHSSHVRKCAYNIITI
jgi:hypothetical protein